MATTLEHRLAERERPTGRVFGFQRWDHLLFAHWSWDPDAIQRTLPAGLRVDTHEGRAYVGVVPFFMNRIRPAHLPTVPWLSSFLELNLRTYVIDEGGRPGVWFYSLDCSRTIAVWIARWQFHLPYHRAEMSARITDGIVTYASRRRNDERMSRFTYAPASEVMVAVPGTMEFFLVERYRLYTWRASDGRLCSGQVHHAPYPLSLGRLENYDDRVLELAGLGATNRPPELVHYARRVDVEVFALTEVS